MRPGTTSNLSFNSSSDYSAHLVPLDECDTSSLASGNVRDPQYISRFYNPDSHPRDVTDGNSKDCRPQHEDASTFAVSQDTCRTSQLHASGSVEKYSSSMKPSSGVAMSSAIKDLEMGEGVVMHNHASFEEGSGLNMIHPNSTSHWGHLLNAAVAGVQNCGKFVKNGINHAVGRMLGIKSSTNITDAQSCVSSVKTDSLAPEGNIRGLDSPPSSPYSPKSKKQLFQQKSENDREVIRTDCIFVSVDQESNLLFRPANLLANPTTGESQLLKEVTREEEFGVENEVPVYEVDLISALESYLDNPNECFSHLVAAALASRSVKRPVTGVEVAAAQYNPFIVRLIVASGCLDVEDTLARQEVQETIDSLFPLDCSCLSPTVYDYLKSFLELPFVKLSYDQYALLKMSGFEYIILMRKYSHVLRRDKFYTILFNYSSKMLLLNWIFVFVSLVVNTLITLSIINHIVIWFYRDNELYRVNGIYSLVVFGCGYVVNFVTMVYFTQRKEDTSRYEDTGVLKPPSLYVVLFLFPFYELFCLITLTRAIRRKKLVLVHNLLALSRTSGMCSAMWLVIPQILVQRFLIFSTGNPELENFHLNSSVLIYLGIGQWSLALFRYGYMLMAYDSIDYFGYASFKRSIPKNYLERHPGILILLNHYTTYIAEVAIYTVIVSFIEMYNTSKCKDLTVPVICISVSMLLAASVMFTTLIFNKISVGFVSFFNIITICFLVVIKMTISHRYPSSEDIDCYLYAKEISYDFPFVDVLWIVYEVLFFCWFLLVLSWPLRKFFHDNIFQNVVFPLLQRVFCLKNEEQSKYDQKSVVRDLQLVS
ncbi:unnamed protein product [Phytomonas sp. Hart1]|nr:unnamed protein product [Phytomonas sp. Hart1]|eukprot:CCW71485.1 unnamed protein product [Phytomonas sp. isolate Hart1]